MTAFLYYNVVTSIHKMSVNPLLKSCPYFQYTDMFLFNMISIYIPFYITMPIVKFLLSSLIIVLYLEIFFHILKSYHETVLFEFE